jgi:FkbM family methyltransferase
MKEGDMVFDVGANRGDRSEIFLSLGTQVVAVEPQSSCVRLLKERFRDDSRITIVEKALAKDEGWSPIRLSDNDLVSSMSPEWIERAASSGRFDDSRWGAEINVRTTTLDALIASHGIPSFIKIDVEGYESVVLQGLSMPVPRLSFEYTPEHLGPARECLERLSSLGPYSFNISVDESMELSLPSYVGKVEMGRVLEAIEQRAGEEPSGDIYAAIARRGGER